MVINNNGVKNRLQEVIQAKEKSGFPFKPSNDFYTEMGIHKRKFGQFIRNEKQPTLDELQRISSKLSVTMNELVEF